jgi:hypothetical protein
MTGSESYAWQMATNVGLDVSMIEVASFRILNVRKVTFHYMNFAFRNMKSSCNEEPHSAVP